VVSYNLILGDLFFCFVTGSDFGIFSLCLPLVLFNTVI